MIYQWKKPMYKVNPQEAGELLQSINETHGGIIPKVVVSESKPEEAILHECFEWENEIAADLYREDQARAIIRNIVIIPAHVSQPQKSSEPVRAFVHVKPENEKPQYMPIQKVMADDNLKSQMLAAALKDLDSFRKKYHELKELSKVFQAIEELI